MGGDYSDEFIVSQITSGQKDLFRLLIRRYNRPVYAMGMSFFRNTEDASDFAQEVFLKVYRSLPHFEGRARFSTWLYKIAYNTALNGVGRRKEYHAEFRTGFRSLAEVDIEPIDGDTPERLAIRGAARDAVLAAVRELPERYRVCVDLFFFYDCPYREIAVITGFPVNTIKSHVFRAKKLLREKLSGIKEE